MRSKLLIFSIIFMSMFIVTGCGNRTVVSCTHNGSTVKYEIEKGKIISASENGKKATNEELEAMKMFNSETNEETLENIKDVWDLVGAECK